MHKLPAGFDADTFVGTEFEQVTFAQNAIHLVFGAGHSVTVLARLRYRVDESAAYRFDTLPHAESALPLLLGRRVERVQVRRDRDIDLHLSLGGRIVFEDYDSHYESYSLKTPKGEVYV